MSPKRELDPEARRLIARLIELEALPWPEGLDDYSEVLVALSVRCEAKPGKAELMRWFERTCRGAIVVHGERRRECLLDGLHDTIAHSAGLLLRFRAGLNPERRPNLGSMLVARVKWRGKDLHKSLYLRQQPYRDDRPVSCAPVLNVPDRGNPETAAASREVWGLLDSTQPAMKALMMVGLGSTIAEAARRTGASRQQIYRARAILTEACDREGGE